MTDLTLSDFHYDLPPEAIAERPASPRESARLLVVRPDGLADRIVADLPDLLQPGDLLVFNDTRVIPARLRGHRGAAQVEALLHRQLAPGRWEAFCRPAKRLRPGERVDFADGFAATVEGRGEDEGTTVLQFDASGAELDTLLAQHGAMPLPPYIRRTADTADSSDYQTIFAREAGAVAAPTASLHYTPELLARLTATGVGHTTVTLHVGAGTFMPVRTEQIAEHKMHAERWSVSMEAAAAINAAKAEGRRIIAVGTTALRTLESAAQADGTVRAGSGETRLFITPGYQFKVIDLLLTNFHLPKSTLLMLVSAFSGMATMRAAYAHALTDGYRFFSYGDTSLLYPANAPDA